MKTLYSLFTLVALSLSANTVNGQEFLVTLKDGSRVYCKINATLEFKTSYGTLKIPASDLVSMRFKFRTTDDERKTMLNAIEGLGSNHYPVRVESENTLKNAGKFAYPFILKRAKDKDLERARRIADLLTKIKETYAEKELNFPETDTFTTKETKVIGEIQLKNMTINTSIGQLIIPVHKITHIHKKNKFNVSMNISYNEGKWTKTDIIIFENMQLNVRALGRIDIYPASPGNYMATADGNDSYTRNGIYCGALIAKIGDGPEFVLGASYSKDVKRTGTLYLRINGGPVNWGNGGNGPSGIFRVRIKSN